jgi:tetratricopeptide (TPR) repeat protein
MKGSRQTGSEEIAQIEALLAAQRFPEALARAQRFLARNPSSAAGYGAVARALLSTGRLSLAAEQLVRGLRVSPTDPTLNLLAGIVDHRLGRSAEAVERLSRLLARKPANEVEVAVALAESLHRAGRREELDALLATGGAWTRDERSAVFVARAHAREDRDGAIARLREVMGSTRNAVLKRVAGFEAVRLLDGAGLYREAFGLAGEVHGATTPTFDLGALEEDVAGQMRQLERGAAWFAPRAAEATGTAFVVGMPRSGTTLLEQMLDRHPQISGIGEYEGLFAIGEELLGMGAWPAGLKSVGAEAVARLAGGYREGASARARSDAAWTFDKTLHAWRMLPAAALVLPGSAFIRIQRDARDTAISMYLSNFHPRSWGFTASLPSIRRVIELERRIVPAMIEALGLRAVSLRYEDLVDEPEREIRRVLELLGLPFDPAVLAPEANTRSVLTLSHEQVRRPINRSSIGRWRNYAFAFDASWDALD